MLSGIKNLTKRQRLYRELQERSYIKYDSILDKANFGRKWLAESSVANLIKSSIHFLEQKEYELYAYTIMPNHIHLIIKPIHEKNIGENIINDKFIYTVTKIMKSFKMFTGREANKLLKRSGPFWQHESYDHVIRNNNDLFRITNYILNNPVKANLCDSQEDWPWNYINLDLYHL
jgi:REP element-mobilizing transposase RayT